MRFNFFMIFEMKNPKNASFIDLFIRLIQPPNYKIVTLVSQYTAVYIYLTLFKPKIMYCENINISLFHKDSLLLIAEI